MANRSGQRGGGVRRRRRGGGAAGGRGLGGLLREANARAHEKANRRLGRRGAKLVQAAIATAMGEEAVGGEVVVPAAWWVQGLRMWLAALLVGPLVVTGWTFLSVLADATMRERFWATAAFWYFATGVLLMGGWFWTGLLRRGFLYLYVLGHELTHILFIVLFRGRVGEWGVTVLGGYVTTNKTNIWIALAPYFVPFWSVVVLGVYAVLEFALPLPSHAEKIAYWLTGWTWAFHMLWTGWMIPLDQPDLQENGTFLSLVIICLANLLVLAVLLCMASDGLSLADFGAAWLAHAREGLEWLRRLAQAIEWPAA